jgi:protein TonB
MFDQLIESSQSRRRKTRLRYFSVTAAVWIAGLALVIVGGVWSYDAHLDDTERAISLAPPQLPPPRGTTHAPQKRESIQPAARQQNEMVAQVKSPDRVSDVSRSAPPIVDFVIAPGGNEPGGPGGGGGSDHGVVGVTGDSTERSSPEPPQPEKEKKDPPQPQPHIQIVRSGGVIQGTAIRRVNPIYPPLARAARVSGAVVVEVVVNQAGAVTSARTLSGHALLREAAAAAALQWKWNPTFLTGVPVQVVGTITFNFTL